METDADEWRFQWGVDPRDGRQLFQIEHDVRSMKHRLFNRPLVNRNHGITNMTYVPGARRLPRHLLIQTKAHISCSKRGARKPSLRSPK
jgi:hypothetical protein